MMRVYKNVVVFEDSCVRTLKIIGSHDMDLKTSHTTIDLERKFKHKWYI